VVKHNMKTPQKKYLMICSDKYSATGAIISAYDYVRSTLAKSIWHLFQRTSYKDSIAVGDHLFFYIAGAKSHAGQVVGNALVVRDRDIRVPSFDEFGNPIYRTLELDDVEIYSNPFNLRQKIHLLSLGESAAEAGNKWGSVLMGGAKILTENDAHIISKEANK
jgi:hypothetical protein